MLKAKQTFQLFGSYGERWVMFKVQPWGGTTTRACIRMLTETPQVNLHLFQNVKIFYVFLFLSVDGNGKNN